MNTLLGIEIGGTKLQLVAGTDAGRIHDRRRVEVERERGGTGIREQLAVLLPELIHHHQPVAIGVGFGGPINHRTGRIIRSHQLAGWNGFELGEWLHEQTGLPVATDNDANVAALGEALCGAGRDADPVFYVTLGSGVGGGLVNGGAIYHGAIPGEAEVGHLRLDHEGTIVEDRCSGWAVDRRIQAGRETHPDSWLVQRAADMERGHARHLAGALERDDAFARELLHGIAADLSFALSHVVHLMHPQRIVLGGGLSLVGEPLRAAVAATLDQFVMRAMHPVPEVRLSELGEDVVPVGALKLAAAIAL